MFEREGTLRCGRCFRNLTTDWGRDLHLVYEDGSMRCYANEAQDSPKSDERGTYASTFVVLESAQRHDQIRSLVRGEVASNV